MTKTSVCVVLVCLVITGSAVAAPTVDITRISGHYSGDGGEFNLSPNAEFTALTGETEDFASFCLERNEYINLGATYSVVLNDQALRGGVGGQEGSGGDPLDARTAYLYSNFRANTLTGYNHDTTSAGALQDVIWYLEDEMAKNWTDGDGSLRDTFYQAAQNAVDSGAWIGLGNVRVLNIYANGHAGDDAYRKQDMLTTATVPAPGALVLGALGSCLVGFLRRRTVL